MTDTDKIPVAVVGLGHFGRFHAQKWRQTPGARLVALVDRDQDRARAVAEELGGGLAILDDPAALIGLARAASVAVPTAHHFDVARRLIDGGLHVLVEKPLAATLDQADALIAAAAKRGVLLQVGHQERYFFQRLSLADRVSGPLTITSRRLGQPSGRPLDCSVVLDLMIHDIDLAVTLVGAPITRVEAEGVVSDTGFVDRATACLVFADGSRAELHADRAADQRERRFHIAHDAGRVEIDFLARRARDGAGVDLPLAPVDPALEADTLLAETTAFIRAVSGAAPLAVDGAAGRRALAAGLAIDAALGAAR